LTLTIIHIESGKSITRSICWQAIRYVFLEKEKLVFFSFWVKAKRGQN